MFFKNADRPIIRGKSLIDPENVIAVNHHGACLCYTECRNISVPENVWQLNHYRNRLKEDTDNMTIKDSTVWKYGERLVGDVRVTLEATGFKP